MVHTINAITPAVVAGAVVDDVYPHPLLLHRDRNRSLAKYDDPVRHVLEASREMCGLLSAYQDNLYDHLSFSMRSRVRTPLFSSRYFMDVYAVSSECNAMPMLTFEGDTSSDHVTKRWHNSQLQRICEGE